jgi:hypothetical protein
LVCQEHVESNFTIDQVTEDSMVFEERSAKKCKRKRARPEPRVTEYAALNIFNYTPKTKTFFHRPLNKGNVECKFGDCDVNNFNLTE